MRHLLPLMALLLLTPAGSRAAEPMRLLESRPAAASVMRGNSQEFYLRFDGPVDHHAARLSIHRGEVLVRTLQPRLGAAPDTLFAIAGSLPPGAYVLRWAARSMRDGAVAEGEFGFAVQP